MHAPGRLFPLLFACLLTLGASAQDASLVPEIRQELAAATNDTLRADALARICFNLIRSDPDSARLVGDQALALAKQIHNSRALGDAHNNLGWLAADRGEYRRSDSLLHIALAWFKRIGEPQLIAIPLSNLGWLADKQGDRVTALKRFQEALALGEQVQDSNATSKLYYSIGITYRKSGDHAHALEYLDRSLAMERALGRRNAEANCLVGIANTQRELGDTAKAIDALEQAGRLYAALDDHSGAGLVQENLGDIESERAPLQALRHYAVALVEYDSVDSRVDKAYVLLGTGLAELKLDRTSDAEEHLRQGTMLAAGIGDHELTMAYELAFAQLAKVQGDAAATYAHYARYTALKDSLQGAGTQRELARLRTEFETERTEKDNAILRAEDKRKSERLRRQEIQLYGSLLIGALALLAALLFFRNFSQKRKHAEVLEGLNAKLSTSNSEINEINGLLEMKLLRSQMNPHFIYNCLNSAARMTQAGQSVEALAYLRGLARLLRMVLDQSVNDRSGLTEEADFLRQYLKLESHRLGDLHYEVNVEAGLIDEGATIPALIIQPFVENAVWHGLADKAGAKTITVDFRGGEKGIICTITDNGVGRGEAAYKEPSADEPAHKSLGMQLTNERLKLMARRMADENAIRVEDLIAPDGSPAGTRVTVVLI